MTIEQLIQSRTQDAVLHYCLKQWSMALDAIQEQAAIRKIVDLFLSLSEIKRDTYVKKLADEIKKRRADIQRAADALLKRIKSLIKSDIDQEELASLEAEHDTLLATIMPELKPKDLLKYIKLELTELEKSKKEKQSLIFDRHGDHDMEALDDEDDPWLKVPRYMDADEVKLNGFCMVSQRDALGKPVKHGYYSYNPGERKSIEISNFSITPIFHIKAGRESRHLIEVDNGYKKAVLDVESKAMVAIDIMQQYLVGEGNFIIYGAKAQYLRVASKLLQEFRECTEVKALGWQRHGFHAFVNKVYIPGKGLVNMDEWGVIDVEEQNFLIPAASAVYRKLLKSEDDPYENDRPMEYIEPSINFNTWAKMMKRVYADKGTVAVAYCILATFRDIAFDIDNNFPHLYAFGERSSGKSKWAESINNFFYHKRSMFNLNSGTDFAFFKYMGQFRNAVACLNEFDEQVIKPEWFQNIKGVFDGESRQRGSMTNRGKTETMKVESGLVLIGQYLVTMDDNSVVTRSLIESFSERPITEEDKLAYNELKITEEKGITGLITDLLPLRDHFKENYRETFNTTLSQWRSAYTNGANFNQRIMQNWCHLYTAMNLASQKISISSIDILDFKAYCFARAEQWCKFIRSSDTLSEFWNTLLFLAESSQIKINWDYRIDTKMKVLKRIGREEQEEKHFTEPTKVLFLRLNNIHKLYQTAYRMRTGKEGMSAENLLHYFSSRPYFIGPVKSVRFDRGDEAKVTNAYAFYYEQLELDLEILSKYDADKKMKEDNVEEPPLTNEPAPF